MYSIYVFEINSDNKSYIFLYKYDIEDNLISHCCLINHKILDRVEPHYELITINNINFDIIKLNSGLSISNININKMNNSQNISENLNNNSDNISINNKIQLQTNKNPEINDIY